MIRYRKKILVRNKFTFDGYRGCTTDELYLREYFLTEVKKIRRVKRKKLDTKSCERF